MTGVAAEPDGPSRPQANLADRAARGAAVTMTGQLLRIVLQLAGVVVLARLLDAHDYGLLAVVVVVVGVGDIFRDFGLSTAAIQARTLSTAQRDVLFWTNTAIGLVLTGLACAAAPLLARGFGEPALEHMLQVTAITFACNGLATQYRAHLTRNLRFARLVVVDVTSQATGLALGIVLAELGAGYWALAAQLTGQAFAALVLVAMLSGWLPGRPRRGSGMRSFVRFGQNLALSTIVNYVSNNLDVLTIATRLGTTPLGIYNRGFSLLSSPLNQLRSPATTVALPVLSRLQDDHRRAGEYLKIAQVAFGYTVGAALAICAGTSAPVVHLVLGAKWAAVAPVLTCLAVAGASTLLSYVGFWVYLSRGLGRELFHYTCVTFVLQAACIVTGSEWGVNGVAAGYMVAAIVEWPLSLCWLSRRTAIPLRDLLTGALRMSACAVLAGLAAWQITHLGGRSDATWKIVPAVLAGLAVYLVAVLVVPAVRRDVHTAIATGRRIAGRVPGTSRASRAAAEVTVSETVAALAAHVEGNG